VRLHMERNRARTAAARSGEFMHNYRVGRLTIETAFVGCYRSSLRNKDGEVLACGESQTGWTEAVRVMSRSYQETVMNSINQRASAAVA
jgi:hypothetical protein